MAALRNPNIALGVVATLTVLGWLAVGRDPTEAELKAIYFGAVAVGVGVLLALDARDRRRSG